jgi:hypothetical protein
VLLRVILSVPAEIKTICGKIIMIENKKEKLKFV